MSDTLVSLKTIADMQNDNINFYIDAYQRGYRWTESQVKDLLDDIHEFSQTANVQNEKFYCLQPVIVTRSEDGLAWKVIDGQQRLTTLYLIYIYYVNIAGKIKPKLPFGLSYNNKDRLEKCFEEIRSGGFSESAELVDFFAKYEDDIDCYYITKAYEVICDFFSRLFENAYTQNHGNAMKNVFDLHMKIIWYELLQCDAAKEIAMFTKINMGKIALTNAELIKALLLKNDENDKYDIRPYQENIAVKWDEIEAQLSDTDFWSFLVNENRSKYVTRIDFIFNIMAHELNDGILKEASSKYSEEESYYVEEKYNSKYFSFYVFNNYVKYLINHENGREDSKYINDIWNGICEYFRMFKDWYRSRRWYHMIGFIVEVSKNDYITKIYELSQLYKVHDTKVENEGHKTLFERKLREMIAYTIFKQDMCTNKSCTDYVKDLGYGKSKVEDIRNILLLYNICSLELLEKTDSRFPFGKYKDKEVAWDIEHINAVADDRPNDDVRDVDNNPCLLWLNNTEFIPDVLETVDGKNVKELIEKVKKEKLYLSKNQRGTEDFIKVYDTVISYFGDSDEPDNSIGNLTLLDSGTNRSYKNDIFPLKRKKILEKCVSDIYIPLCTKNIFLKAYIQATDLLKWRKVDKENYEEDMVDKISMYLRLEVEADGNK